MSAHTPSRADISRDEWVMMCSSVFKIHSFLNNLSFALKKDFIEIIEYIFYNGIHILLGVYYFTIKVLIESLDLEVL